MAMLRSLVCAVLWHGSIETTEAKAKSARSLLERMITLARTPDLHSRRMARRVVKLGFRRGDAAPVAKLELVDFPSK